VKYAISCNPKPGPDCTKKGTLSIIKESRSFNVDDRAVDEIISPAENAFPNEYAVSGWFKWVKVEQQPWHLAFRVTLND
jgi:hypothetical protein